MPIARDSAPMRLFLDAGVLIDGHFNRWGVCKALTILTTLRHRFRAVLADPIRAEFERNLATKAAHLSGEERQLVQEGVVRWTAIARPERLPYPTLAEMKEHAHLLAVVRHGNDMPAVVAAVLARPDWVLSTNTDHWNDDLAARTGLRVATPYAFLDSLAPSSLQ